MFCPITSKFDQTGYFLISQSLDDIILRVHSYELVIYGGFQSLKSRLNLFTDRMIPLMAFCIQVVWIIRYDTTQTSGSWWMVILCCWSPWRISSKDRSLILKFARSFSRYTLFIIYFEIRERSQNPLNILLRSVRFQSATYNSHTIPRSLFGVERREMSSRKMWKSSCTQPKLHLQLAENASI